MKVAARKPYLSESRQTCVMGEGEDGVPQDVANVHVEHPATCLVREAINKNNFFYEKVS